MGKIGTISLDFLSLFVATFVAQVIVFGSNLFATSWATWKEAIASAIISGLTVVAAALNPTVKRYGIGGK